MIEAIRRLWPARKGVAPIVPEKSVAGRTLLGAAILLPIAIIVNAEEYVTIDESVKGIAPTIASTMLYHNAYLEK